MSQSFATLTASMIPRRLQPTPGEPIYWLKEAASPAAGTLKLLKNGEIDSVTSKDAPPKQAQKLPQRLEGRIKKTLRISPELNEQLTLFARTHNVSQQSMMEAALKSSLQNSGKTCYAHKAVKE